MGGAGSGGLPVTGHLAERQMLLRHIRDKVAISTPARMRGYRFRFITISRQCGSLGDEIAESLGASLNWHVFDREIVDQIAHNSHVRQSLVEHLDAESQNLVQDTIRRVLTLAEGNSFGVEEYRLALLKTFGYIATRGEAILLGRGANIALRNTEGGFHLRFIASAGVRAERLAQRWQVPLAEAHRRMQEVDKERTHFVRNYFKQNAEDDGLYDLVVNTTFISVADVVRAMTSMIRLPAAGTA